MTSALRSAATYLALVGAPLLGLVLVLRWGASLEAPPAVAGEWTLEEASSIACLGLADGAPLVVEQSGRFLRLRAGDALAGGRMDHARMRVAIVARDGACAGTELALDATFDGDALRGRIDAPGCEPCASSPLLAHRRAP